MGPRRGRIGLFLPFILLAVLVAAWSGGWFWLRDRADREIDAWVAGEAAAGRAWTCADRTLTGYPFRLELRCASLTFVRADSRFSLGPLTLLVQVYQPRHGLLLAQGPFHVEQNGLVGDVTWRELEGSFHGASDGFVRGSVVADGVKGSVVGAAAEPVDFATDHLEIHARPTPGRFAQEGAVDASVRVVQARIPIVDSTLGNGAPADIALDATVTRATMLRTGTVARELDAWQAAGGTLEIMSLAVNKGERRLQAHGSVSLDGEHRPQGQLDLRAAGLESIVGQMMGQKLGTERGALIGNLVGQLLGGGRRGSSEAPQASTDAAMKALPPLRMAEGRLMLGPFPIPNLRLPALY